MIAVLDDPREDTGYVPSQRCIERLKRFFKARQIKAKAAGMQDAHLPIVEHSIREYSSVIGRSGRINGFTVVG